MIKKTVRVFRKTCGVGYQLEKNFSRRVKASRLGVDTREIIVRQRHEMSLHFQQVGACKQFAFKLGIRRQLSGQHH